MKLPSSFSFVLLALPGVIYAGSLLPRATDLIPQPLLDKARFLEQYAAAAYCSENFKGTIGTPLRCKALNCPDVEKDTTQIVRPLFK
jgi:hypothetical protein